MAVKKKKPAIRKKTTKKKPEAKKKRVAVKKKAPYGSKKKPATKKKTKKKVSTKRKPKAKPRNWMVPHMFAYNELGECICLGELKTDRNNWIIGSYYGRLKRKFLKKNEGDGKNWFFYHYSTDEKNWIGNSKGRPFFIWAQKDPVSPQIERQEDGSFSFVTMDGFIPVERIRVGEKAYPPHELKEAYKELSKLKKLMKWAGWSLYFEDFDGKRISYPLPEGKTTEDFDVFLDHFDPEENGPLYEETAVQDFVELIKEDEDDSEVMSYDWKRSREHHTYTWKFIDGSILETSWTYWCFDQSWDYNGATWKRKNK